VLLKSDLSGYIEDPNYYFTNPSDKTRADLDLLMLTQGYRRFEWKKILAKNTQDTIYKPEKGFTISGIVKTPDGVPVPKAKVILTSTKKLFSVGYVDGCERQVCLRRPECAGNGRVSN